MRTFQASFAILASFDRSKTNGAFSNVVRWKSASRRNCGFSAAAKPAPEARDTKTNNAPRAAKPAPSAKPVSAQRATKSAAKAALEGLKRIRAKARLDKMAIPKPAPTVIKPAVIVAKPPPPRPTWVAPLATLAVAAVLVVCACTGVIAYLTTQPGQTNVAANAEIRNVRETVAQLRKQVSGRVRKSRRPANRGRSVEQGDQRSFRPVRRESGSYRAGELVLDGEARQARPGPGPGAGAGCSRSRRRRCR